MSDSPTSTRLETPLSTRTSRARKPVKHYGSFLDSDQLPEDEDHQEEDDVVDDEDESFKVKGGKEESEDEVFRVALPRSSFMRRSRNRRNGRNVRRRVSSACGLGIHSSNSL